MKFEIERRWSDVCAANRYYAYVNKEFITSCATEVEAQKACDNYLVKEKHKLPPSRWEYFPETTEEKTERHLSLEVKGE